MIARVELHLSEGEFADLDYRQLALLHERAQILRWQDQWQQGAIASAIYRNGMRNYDPAPKPDDFIFTVHPNRKLPKSPSRKRMTKKRQMAIADLFRNLAGVQPPCPAK